jgi:hypothetical protein
MTVRDVLEAFWAWQEFEAIYSEYHAFSFEEFLNERAL